MGRLNLILGLQVEYKDSRILIIHQKNYIDKIIKTFDLYDTKSVDIPLQPNQYITDEPVDKNEQLREFINSNKYKKAIGMLIYLMVGTRPDICYTVSVLSRYMQNPRELHWRFVKKLLKYIKTTKDFCLVYTKNKSSDSELIGYSDAEYAGSVEDRR